MTLELDRLLDTMVSGFQDDPLYVWLYPDPHRRPHQLRPTFDITLRNGMERGDVRWSDDLHAVSIWTPPDVALLDDDTMGRWLDQLRSDVGPRFDAAVAGMAACAAHEPTDPHWTLHSIVVAAERQGRGLGTQLLRATLVDVDASGDVAYLESSNTRNLTAYERVGFRTVGEVQLADGPIMRPMVRSATA